VASANAAEGGNVPTYQYACTDCGDKSEVVQRFTDDPLTVCVVCGGRLRKVFSAVGIVFKGSGFYRTDSRNGSSTVTAGKDTGASGTNGSASDSPASTSSSSSSSTDSSGSGSASSATGEKKSSVAASSKAS
jgi:putative FmdB family regulatory protein